MVIYSSFLPSQLHKAIYETKADTPLAQLKVRIFGFLIVGVIALSTLMMVGAVYLLKEVFGWAVSCLEYFLRGLIENLHSWGMQVVRSLSADLKLKRMYTRYQLLVSLDFCQLLKNISSLTLSSYRSSASSSLTCSFSSEYDFFSLSCIPILD